MAKRRNPNPRSDHGKRIALGKTRPVVTQARKDEPPPEAYHLMNFEITWDIMPDPDVEALPRATRDRMQKLFDLVHEKPKSVITELRELSVRHPEVPCLRNWLISTLRAGSDADHAEALAICEQLFHDRPDYFFARTTLADLWLDAGEVEKAAELIFAPELVLTRLYPGRTVFHISEIRHWAYLCGRVKILQGEPEIAKGYRDMLEELEPGSQPVRHLNEMLDGEAGLIGKLMAGLKKITDQAEARAEKRRLRKMAKEAQVMPDNSAKQPPSSTQQPDLFGDD